MDQALYRTLSKREDVSITVRNHPLPLTYYEIQSDTALVSIAAVILMLLAASFIPAGIAGVIAREKEPQSNAKQLQIISGTCWQ